jgi:hypothetical protein
MQENQAADHPFVISARSSVPLTAVDKEFCEKTSAEPQQRSASSNWFAQTFTLLSCCSMSPMRGDVKEKFFPLPLRVEIDVATCIQPDLRSEEALGS